jgi:O-antigen/teichoic acid export membrane protein
MTRLYLALAGLLLLSGAAYLFVPSLFEMNGQALTTPAARTDVRAIYGALSIGLALFLAPGVFRAGGHANELRLSALVFGALALGRVFGVLVDGGDQSFNYGAIVFEALFAIGALLLWLRERRPTPAGA